MQDIRTHFGESCIVRSISVKVQEGQILALPGRNGVGKTTMLQAISELDDRQLTKDVLLLN